MRVGNPSYIEIYDNALNKKECDILINQFEKSTPTTGMTGMGFAPHIKECLQLDDTFLSDGSIISNIVKPILIRYVDKYNQQYSKLLERTGPWKYNDNYSFQKYETEDDGYKAWHCEHAYAKGYDGLEGASRRILAWMFYLNNAKSGTEFMQYPTVRARMGRCVIWPAGWTHVHRGVIPNKGLKYIITGWVSLV